MENNEIQDEMIEVTLTDQNGQEYKVYYIWFDILIPPMLQLT